MTASTISPALHDWARRHAIRLADQFIRDEDCDRDPRAYFEAHCGAAGLTPALRATAEPAFMARVAARADSHG